MTDAPALDRVFHTIVRRLVDTGQAPHYTELGTALGRPVEDARQLLHRVIDVFLPAWLYPETDYIASFPPFNNLPTQHRISVDGRQRWFAQCGFESLAMTWMFPGQVVRVDTPCLDCGEPIVIEMRDGAIRRVEPAGVVGHLNRPWALMKDRLAAV